MERDTVTYVPTCDIYLRLSDARIEEAFDGREAKLRTYAASIGWIVHRVVVENDVMADGRPKPASAFKRKKIKTPSGRVEYRVVRPKFREVLEDITTGRVNGLLAEDLDRTVRDPRDLEDLLEACEMTGSSARSLSGSLTLTNGGTDAEKMTARIMVATANKSSADTARRVAEGRERNHGKSYGGGPRPYGYVAAQDTERYQRTLIIVPDEADILLKASDDILNKDISLRAVAKDFRERGVPNTKGNTNWTARTVKEVLTKPAIAGLAVHKGNLKPAPWPVILERDVWERLSEKLNDPTRRTSDRSNEPRWLLSGIAKCGPCNNETTVRATGARDKTFYTCRQGYHLKRNARNTDAYVEEIIVEYLDRYGRDILKPRVRKDIDTSELRAEAKKLRERKTTQLRMHAEGLIDDSDLARTLRNIKDRLTVIDAQLAASDEPDPLAEFRDKPAETVWKSLPLARKRAIVKRLVDVTILPTNLRGRAGFDPDSINIIPKF